LTPATIKLQDKITGTARKHASLHGDWANFITRNLCRFSFRTRKEANFEVNASVRTGDGFMVARFKTIAGNAELDRGCSDIGRDGQDAYALYMPVQGQHEISQLGRRERCIPGSVMLVTMAEPLLHTKLGDNDTDYLFLPREFVDQRLMRAEDRCARAVVAEQGVQRLLCESISAFQSASRVIGDLVLLAISGSADLMSDLRSVRAGNLGRAKRIIRARLTDPDLSLAAIAAECGLSLRYLHALFRDEGCTAGEYLKRERLQRAHRLLEISDPSCVTVTEVALACGFSNPSQFSTAFRRGFSMSPKDVMRRR
jgi:AraC-like DNA-binding protein